MKTKVAALRTKPETVLEDYDRLLGLAEVEKHLAPGATTILKDNISWHFPFPGANTTPWQLDGTVQGLRNRDYADLSCVQNKTVVTNAFKGEDLNGYVPILRRHGVPILYNFRDQDMRWVEYQPKAKMLVLHDIYPEGISIPDYFFGKNIVHLPTVKCVAGDTEIMLADGSVVAIRDVVARQTAGIPYAIVDGDGDTRVAGQVELLAMTPEGKVRPAAASWFWRTHAGGRRVLRLRTRTGRTLTATADHLIHTPGGWTPLGDLVVGARVAIARRLKVSGISQPLPQIGVARSAEAITARAGRKYTAAFSQRVIDDYRSGATATAIAEEAGIRWQSVQRILKRHGIPVRGNVAQLRVPERTSPAFWRWFGYVAAEGCIERGDTSDKLWWTNVQPEIRDDFRRLTHELFGLEAKEHRTNPGMHIYGRQLGRFFELLGLPVPFQAGNKRVPELLFRCPDDEIAAFLSGYLDGDGSVSSREAEVAVTTKSPELAQDLQILFARLGVVAFCRPVQRTIPGKWDQPRTYSHITVSGADLARLASGLDLRHLEKRRRLNHHVERLATSKQPSNWDIVPIAANDFRAVREGVGLTQIGTGKPSSAENIELGNVRPTPRIARYFVNLFEQHDVTGRFAGEVARLRALASEDLAWDQVAAVEEVPDDHVELFDLTVPGADSFVASGLIVHNCHIYTSTTGAMKNAFGGLLNTKRHYTHSWIHPTLVDLLAIQKEIHSGIFAVMDGTTAGDGPGPRTMRPVVKNVILAAADQVAIDAVAARLMGFDPLTIDYIRLAHQAGLGCGDPREIELVGDADLANERWGFSVGDNGASRIGDLLWFGPLKRFQNFFFRTPLVNAFILGSEVYHDYYRWPARDRRVFEQWLEGTPWGRLFSEYVPGPAAEAPVGAGRPGGR